MKKTPTQNIQGKGVQHTRGINTRQPHQQETNKPDQTEQEQRTEEQVTCLWGSGSKKRKNMWSKGDTSTRYIFIYTYNHSLGEW